MIILRYVDIDELLSFLTNEIKRDEEHKKNCNTKLEKQYFSGRIDQCNDIIDIILHSPRMTS